jgi:hypothetical protein
MTDEAGFDLLRYLAVEISSGLFLNGKNGE